MRSKIGRPEKGFQWKGRDILIVTGNDPITGKFRNPENRDPKEITHPILVLREMKRKLNRVKLIKQNTSIVKMNQKERGDLYND